MLTSGVLLSGGEGHSYLTISAFDILLFGTILQVALKALLAYMSPLCSEITIIYRMCEFCIMSFKMFQC